MRYDLKAVLMHDGLSGPEHVWAYVQHEERWWRVCQGEAQEVRNLQIMFANAC